MITRRKETSIILSTMLLLYLLIFTLFTGCESQNPTGISSNSSEQNSIQQTNKATANFEWLPKLICFLFPQTCESDPDIEQVPVWGGKNWTPTKSEVENFGKWHNDCLTAFSLANMQKDACLRIMDSLAVVYKINYRPNSYEQEMYGNVIVAIAQQKLTLDDMPGFAETLKAFTNLDPNGPFGNKEKILRKHLLVLEDGISAEDVELWRNFSESIPDTNPKEKWAANTMTASVEWWFVISENLGPIYSLGVYADLTALVNGGSFEIIALCSAVGLTLDVINFCDDHFWGD
jgi:hypothetical protein